MDKDVIEMMNDRFDRLENKIDSINEHRWMQTGRMSMLTFLGSIVVSFIISKVWK